MAGSRQWAPVTQRGLPPVCPVGDTGTCGWCRPPGFVSGAGPHSGVRDAFRPSEQEVFSSIPVDSRTPFFGYRPQSRAPVIRIEQIAAPGEASGTIGTEIAEQRQRYKRTLGQGPKPGCSTEPAAIAAHQRERFAGDGEIFGRGGRLTRKIFRNLDGQAIANTPECSKGHCVARGLTADEGIVFKEHFRPPSIQEVLHWSHAKSNRNAPPADLEQPDFLSVMSARTSAELAARSLDRK
jgi:hypothetical protein